LADDCGIYNAFPQDFHRIKIKNSLIYKRKINFSTFSTVII